MNGHLHRRRVRQSNSRMRTGSRRPSRTVNFDAKYFDAVSSTPITSESTSATPISASWARASDKNEVSADDQRPSSRIRGRCFAVSPGHAGAIASAGTRDGLVFANVDVRRRSTRISRTTGHITRRRDASASTQLDDLETRGGPPVYSERRASRAISAC